MKKTSIPLYFFMFWNTFSTQNMYNKCHTAAYGIGG